MAGRGEFGVTDFAYTNIRYKEVALLNPSTGRSAKRKRKLNFRAIALEQELKG